MAAPLAIPTIDITALLTNTSTTQDKQNVAVELLNAFTTYGVFYITSPTHPLFTTENTNQVLDATKRLFDLDAEQKAHIPKIQPGGFTRGYVPIGGESGSATKELKEGFSYGYEWSEEALKAKQAGGSLNGLQGPNAWPAQASLDQLDQGHKDAFKGTLQEFYLHVCDIAKGLLKGISLALALPEEELSKYCTTSETISFMRLFHYLPYADQGHTSQIGSRYAEKKKRKACGVCETTWEKKYEQYYFVTYLVNHVMWNQLRSWSILPHPHYFNFLSDACLHILRTFYFYAHPTNPSLDNNPSSFYPVPLFAMTPPGTFFFLFTPNVVHIRIGDSLR
jgi:hypothetical protein